MIISGRVRSSVLFNRDIVFEPCVFLEAWSTFPPTHIFPQEPMCFHTETKPRLRIKPAAIHRKLNPGLIGSFLPLLKKEILKALCMYKYGFVENISDLWINWSIYQIKDCAFRESTVLFFLEWWQWIHIETINSLSLSLLSDQKVAGGRWLVKVQGAVSCHGIIPEWLRNTLQHHPHDDIFFLKDA